MRFIKILSYSLDVRKVPYHNFVLIFMFSYLNCILYTMMRCRSKFELAALIRVQNLSQTAIDFRKKWHIWKIKKIRM
jgi:hypothetical protein